MVVDDAAGPGSWAAVAGTTVLRVGAPPGRRPAPAVVRLLVGAGRARPGWTVRGSAGAVGRPDVFSVAEATALARRLARYRPAGAGLRCRPGHGGGPARAARPGPAGAGARRAAITADAVEHCVRATAAVPRTGCACRSASTRRARRWRWTSRSPPQGGSGPHGLCIGATGSGKSELLRTLVLGLVATHSSAELNLVLVDFKGGATFLGLAGLPHVSAVITNLADELPLVDRMADALEGEITRRQELLRAAGNLTGTAEYAAVRRTAGSDLPPLPALLVVVDEFSELLAQRPELIELLGHDRAARPVARACTCCWRRSGWTRAGCAAWTRTCPTASRCAPSRPPSRARCWGCPDAHQLPSAPGSAFLATGTGELVRFRAAYVSGPARHGSGRTSRGPPRPRRAHRFRVGPVGAAPAPGPLRRRGRAAPRCSTR